MSLPQTIQKDCALRKCPKRIALHEEKGLDVQNLRIYNNFHIHFSIHVDPLKSLYFQGISLDPEIFTKQIRNQSVSEFIFSSTK